MDKGLGSLCFYLRAGSGGWVFRGGGERWKGLQSLFGRTALYIGGYHHGQGGGEGGEDEELQHFPTLAGRSCCSLALKWHRLQEKVLLDLLQLPKVIVRLVSRLSEKL